MSIGGLCAPILHLRTLVLDKLKEGLRRALLTVARRETVNTRRFLERVIEDGFDGIILFDEREAVVRINGEPVADALLCAAAETLSRANPLPRAAAELAAAAACFGAAGCRLAVR